jgi:signal transduction histidine kinase
MTNKVFLPLILLIASITSLLAQINNHKDPFYKRALVQVKLCKKFDNNGKLDSLKIAAKTGLTISTRLRDDSLSAVFNFYIGSYFETADKADSALKYYKIADRYAKISNSNDVDALAQTAIADVFNNKGLSDSLYSYLHIIEASLQKVKDNDIKQVITNRLGGFYNDHNQYEKAITYYLTNIRYNKKSKFDRGVGVALVNIGNTYLQMSKSEKALPYFKEAVAYLRNFKTGQIVCYNNIGATFSNLNKPDSAIVYHLKAIKIARANKDSSNMYAAYEKLSSALTDKKRYNEAEKYLTEALAYALKAKEMTEIIDGYTFLGQVEHAKKNYTAAASDFKKGLGYAINSKHTERETAIYELLAKSQAAGRQYSEAYDYEVKFFNLTDSLNKESSKSSITELASQYQSENKQQQINLLTQEKKATGIELSEQKRTKYFLIASLGLVLIIVGLTIRGYRLKQKANKIALEKNGELEIKNEQLKVLNHELNEANSSKTKLFGILSHDLRAPVGSLFQFLTLQKNHAHKLNEEQKLKHNERIITSAENLMESMEDLLIWSKSQMDSFSLQLSPVNARDLVSSTFDLHRDFAEAKQITLEMECPEDIILDTDVNFMKIVLRNIVSNGIKFTPSGGAIRLIVENGENNVYFKIFDNGVGMTKEQIGNLFEWGSIRSDTSGLGLKLAREFTTRLGGAIGVNSAPGKGTTFTITLPLKQTAKDSLA